MTALDTQGVGHLPRTFRLAAAAGLILRTSGTAAVSALAHPPGGGGGRQRYRGHRPRLGRRPRRRRPRRVLFGALAQFEREIIRNRTMAGLAAARARGRSGGRPSKL